MSADIESDGKVKPLDAKAQPDTVVTAEEVQDAERLARMVQVIVAHVRAVERRWAPRRIDFKDVTCGTSGTLIRLHHGFGGAVRWWVVDWQISGASGAPILQRYTGTDENTLVLWSDKAGIATIRVEEAG
jgi:hypothetical protein